MYLDFYQLREYPFSLACDPRYLYFSQGHREAMAGLLYSLRERKGVALLVGEPGMGKTTLLAAVREMLPGGVIAQALDTPLHATPQDALAAIVAGFGLPAEGLGLSALQARLHEFLLERDGRGECALLVIDEAQDLNPLVLEQVRLLTNLEHEGRKLLQIILSGQPELMQHLRTVNGRALHQRVAVHCRLVALNPAETQAYVKARLEHAGAGRAIFEEAAVARVHELSHGVPRVINVIADHCLLAGFAGRTERVARPLVEKIGLQLGLTPMAPAVAPTRAPAAPGVPPTSAPPAPSAPVRHEAPAAPPTTQRPPVLQRFATGWARWAGLMETK